MGLAEWKGPTFVINSSHLFHFVPSPSFTATTHQNELWLNLIQSTRSTHCRCFGKIGIILTWFLLVLRRKEKAKFFFSSCFSFGYWLVRFSNCLGSELGTWTIPFTKLSECMMWIHHHHHNRNHHHHNYHNHHHHNNHITIWFRFSCPHVFFFSTLFGFCLSLLGLASTGGSDRCNHWIVSLPLLFDGGLDMWTTNLLLPLSFLAFVVFCFYCFLLLLCPAFVVSCFCCFLQLLFLACWMLS